MPVTVQINGKDETVFTQAEHDQAIVAARQEAAVGLVGKDDAEKQAIAAANNAAAKTRKEAADEIKDLQGKLTAAAGDAAKTAELQGLLTEAVGRATTAERKFRGVVILASQTKADVAAAEQLFALPLFATVDLDKPEAVKTAIEQFTTLFPQYKSDAPGTKPGPTAPGTSRDLRPLGGTGGGGNNQAAAADVNAALRRMAGMP
jgi:hypothetical protein